MGHPHIVKSMHLRGKLSKFRQLVSRAALDDLPLVATRFTQECIHFANHLLFTGIVADLTQSKLGLPRSWSLVFVAALCAIAQLSAARMEDVGGLWIVSATLGLAYGGIAGLYPALVIQYFGIGKPPQKLNSSNRLIIYSQSTSARIQDGLQLHLSSGGISSL